MRKKHVFFRKISMGKIFNPRSAIIIIVLVLFVDCFPISTYSKSFVLSAHDIAVDGLKASKSVVGVGFVFSIFFTVRNEGSSTEVFNVTTYANTTPLNQTEMSLENGTFQIVAFDCNTTLWAYGNYTLWSYAEPVPGEVNTTNNNCTYIYPVHVGVPGDVSGPVRGAYDGLVNMRDICYLILRINSSPSSPNWNPNTDINNDNIVNLKDIAVAVINFNARHIYHMAFCSWGDTAAPLPTEAARDIKRFVAIVGKGLYAAENAGTICVNEDFWMLQGADSWKPLIDEGLFKVLIVSIDPYIRSEPVDRYVGNLLVSGPSKVELDIKAGFYDSWIVAIAQECKDFGYPLIIKIGVEVNLNQGGGESNVADYGAMPSAFIGAWRRIVSQFRAMGIKNVEWCLSYNWQSIGQHGVSEYYPGDIFVDLIGIDMYQDNALASEWPVHQIEEIYNNPTFANKPLGITEWGANWLHQSFSDSTRATYVNDFFDCIEQRPRIKFIRYHWNMEFRFQNDDPSDLSTYMPLTAKAYARRVANRLYVT